MAYREFRDQPGDQSEALASAVLEELPYQVTSYYRSINKPPGAPPRAAELQGFYRKFEYVLMLIGQRGWEVCYKIEG